MIAPRGLVASSGVGGALDAPRHHDRDQSGQHDFGAEFGALLVNAALPAPPASRPKGVTLAPATQPSAAEAGAVLTSGDPTAATDGSPSRPLPAAIPLHQAPSPAPLALGEADAAPPAVTPQPAGRAANPLANHTVLPAAPGVIEHVSISAVRRDSAQADSAHSVSTENGRSAPQTGAFVESATRSGPPQISSAARAGAVSGIKAHQGGELRYGPSLAPRASSPIHTSGTAQEPSSDIHAAQPVTRRAAIETTPGENSILDAGAHPMPLAMPPGAAGPVSTTNPDALALRTQQPQSAAPAVAAASLRPASTVPHPIEPARTAILKVELADGVTAHARVSERAGAVDVRVVTNNSPVAQHVAQQLGSLRGALDGAGLRLEHAGVSYRDDGRSAGRDQRQPPPQPPRPPSEDKLFAEYEVQ